MIQTHLRSPNRSNPSPPTPFRPAFLAPAGPTTMPSLQLSITLDEQLVAFLDQQDSIHSKAVAGAVWRWRDEQWLEQVNRTCTEESSRGLQPGATEHHERND